MNAVSYKSIQVVTMTCISCCCIISYDRESLLQNECVVVAENGFIVQEKAQRIVSKEKTVNIVLGNEDIVESQKKNPKSKEKDLLEFVKRRGLVRVKDVIDAGYYSQTLRRLHQKELLIRVSRGLYSHPDMIPGEHQSLVEVAKRVPRAIVCLLTALRYHNIGTQNPKDVWIALPPNLRKPKMQYPPTRVVRFSGDALTEGVEHHMLRGVEVKIYNPAKTVADCFKHRKKIGLDVAMEALKDVIQRRKCTVDDIWYYAKIDRVTKVIEPYMTAMLA